MMNEHTCKGDTIDATHSCQCDIGHDHSASYHRQQIRERREFVLELARRND